MICKYCHKTFLFKQSLKWNKTIYVVHTCSTGNEKYWVFQACSQISITPENIIVSGHPCYLPLNNKPFYVFSCHSAPGFPFVHFVSITWCYTNPGWFLRFLAAPLPSWFSQQGIWGLCNWQKGANWLPHLALWRLKQLHEVPGSVTDEDLEVNERLCLCWAWHINIKTVVLSPVSIIT